MLIQFGVTGWLIGAGVLAVLLPLVWRKTHHPATLLYFSVFWVYLLAVVQVVIFPFAINTTPAESTFTPSINLVPFYFGTCFIPSLCARWILENTLLTLPMGFGLNFLVRVKPRNFFLLAMAVGLGFELSQLLISYIFKSGFRAVDINDAIFNAAGVLIGYALFRIFARVYLRISNHFRFAHKWLFADIYDIVIHVNTTDRKTNPAEDN
jgi:glycopeptide antibiotics resistance protein